MDDKKKEELRKRSEKIMRDKIEKEKKRKALILHILKNEKSF